MYPSAAPVAQTFFMDEARRQTPNPYLLSGVAAFVATHTHTLPQPKRPSSSPISTRGCSSPACLTLQEIAAACELDGIITVVDTKHIAQHLDEEKPEP